jgi:uncharacterized protein YndB with AHSA1/START domain
VDLSPLKFEIEVDVPPAEAFEVFTTGMESWWPMASHSIGEQQVKGIGFEGREGGRVYEIWANGEEKDWARVLVWDPPNRVTLAWHPSLQPGTPTEVDVRFSARGSKTTVELVHSGWDQVEQHRSDLRSSYETGWVPVIGALKTRF